MLLPLVAALMLLSSAPAYGQSSPSCSGSSSTVTLQMPGSISVPRDAVAGTILSAWVSSQAVTNYFVCRGFATSGTEALTAPLTDSGLRVVNPDTGNNIIVWDTNIAGIGVAIAHRFHANGCSWNPWLGAGAGSRLWTCDGAAPQDNGYQLQIAVVKTATSGSGQVAGKTVTSIYPIGNNTSSEPLRPLSDQRISFAFSSFSVVAQTCSITPPGPVNLGAIPVKTFTGVGSVSPWGASGKFSITVNCSGVKSKVHMVLTDQQNPGNVSSTLPLTRASTATGVGIQIFLDGGATPFSFGPDSSLPGTTNQFLAFTSDNNTVKVEFNTRFIQTASRVTSGTANGIATFTMSYQ
ncbi:fimbrial protein [Herbaspirillum robiniae]|uniref:Fimbrial protein n=1 Tax=Herbaspirillum robiniae TaxID=2014887 RepID=A0ABX2M2A2_9BURK|nr:fimbrial protein [Herbaspirillum robiniae]NUU04506.1 fimbrial protein [Herbaspirillum robiniae]